jgi:hypothetical protein
MPLDQNARLYFGRLEGASAPNPAIAQGYARWADDPTTRRSHPFGGRYENVYIGADRIPALGPLLEQARRLASEACGVPAEQLAVGFWFNAMAPGQRTLRHTHDDHDEVLSGVYYVEAPPDSGDLVVDDGRCRTIVTPRAGLFVLFAPDLPHEVTENRSGGRRLSIGMNFGLRPPLDPTPP